MTEATFDGRKRRYVPIGVEIAHSETGGRLLDKFGCDGLLTWILVLAAAKRNRVEGEFQWYSEEGGWAELGLAYPNTPDFTLEEFFTYTGRIKQTHKTRQRPGRNVTITRWGEWNDAWRKEQGADRSARKRTENTRDDARTKPHDARTEGVTEVEVELEVEVETGSPRSAPSFTTAKKEISEGVRREADRIVAACGDADDESLGVVLSWARQLPVGSVAKVRESCEHMGRVGVGYAVNALKSEIAERAA
jgi:hypothetical protein